MQNMAKIPNVTVTAEGNGSIRGPKNDHYAPGSRLTFVAIPSTGYYFSQWSDGDTTNPRTIKVCTADINITAKFVVATIATVDLGLTSGSLWTTCNVGAANPWDYGHHYNWGDPQAQSQYSQYNYKYGSEKTLIKYNTSTRYGNVDYKTVLESADDVATVVFGDDYSMPTAADWTELRNECYWVWTNNYNGRGVCGYIVYRVKADRDKGTIVTKGNTPSDSYTLKDAHIFLPAAGSQGTSLYDVGKFGLYLSASLYVLDPLETYFCCLMADNVNPNEHYNRSYGYSVRPILHTKLVPIEEQGAHNPLVTIIAGSNGSVTGSENGRYALGSRLTFTAIPDVGYCFKQWSDGITANPRIVDVDTIDIGLTAEFVVANIDTVDLGLTSGNLWAICNVGAITPWNYGYYYAWGETRPKSNYNWRNYKYGNENWLSKYNTDLDKGHFDDKTVLEPDDDAATAEFGADYSTPTIFDWQELSNECYWVWTNDYNGQGVSGYIVFKAQFDSDKGVKVDNGLTPSVTYTLADVHIFLPAAGHKLYGHNYDHFGEYWSASLDSHSPDFAHYCLLGLNNVNDSAWGRERGLSVRPLLRIYSLVTVTAGSNGTVNGPSSGSYISSSRLLFTAIPFVGYYFSHWSDGCTTNPRTVIVNANNITLEAVFAQSPLVNVTAGNNGSVCGHENSRYAPDNSLSFTATPSPGYCFKQWSDGNTANPRIIKVGKTDINLVAEFDVIPVDTVDLGLTSGTLWTTCNVGADNPWNYGNYYAWGETQAKQYYIWRDYKYRDFKGYKDSFTKYNNSASDGIVDNKTILESVDDVATAVLGAGYTIPTVADWIELRRQCYWVWTTDYNGKGVSGYIVYKAKFKDDKGTKEAKGGVSSDFYSLSDSHIFLPAAGFINEDKLSHVGNHGRYWSDSLAKNSPYLACYFGLYSGLVLNGVRYEGYSVRPVRHSN